MLNNFLNTGAMSARDYEKSAGGLTEKMGYFAVIDTETNWNNEVMSIGIAIADDKTFKKIDDLYYVFNPEYKVGGMFSMVLAVKGRNAKDCVTSRKTALERIKSSFAKYQITQLYAYNASFDKNLLPELSEYVWFDIMRIAAYRQYNDKIPANVECCKTGKMKRDYGVEPMMQLLSGNRRYMEVHNALIDAVDELEIMRLLGKELCLYSIAKL